jgi:hypothetical protein
MWSAQACLRFYIAKLASSSAFLLRLHNHRRKEKGGGAARPLRLCVFCLPGAARIGPRQPARGAGAYTNPWSSIALATFLKPAMLAPAT